MRNHGTATCARKAGLYRRRTLSCKSENVRTKSEVKRWNPELGLLLMPRIQEERMRRENSRVAGVKKCDGRNARAPECVGRLSCGVFGTDGCGPVRCDGVCASEISVRLVATRARYLVRKYSACWLTGWLDWAAAAIAEIARKRRRRILARAQQARHAIAVPSKLFTGSRADGSKRRKCRAPRSWREEGVRLKAP